MIPESPGTFEIPSMVSFKYGSRALTWTTKAKITWEENDCGCEDRKINRKDKNMLVDANTDII